MLLQLTQRCSAECTHCLVSATKNGKTMNLETINNAIKYINFVNPKTLIITGGEITEVPFFKKVIEDIYKQINTPNIVLESNGWWLKADIPQTHNIFGDMVELLRLPRIKNLQISSNKNYYPKELYETVCFHGKEIEGYSNKVFVCVDWQNDGKQTEKGIKSLTNLGRAVNLDEGKNTIGKPNCIGVTSRWKQFYKLIEQDKLLRTAIKNHKKELKTEYSKFVFACELSGYLCKPMIDVDGYVHFGESQFCAHYDNVNEYQNLNQIDSFKRMNDIFFDYQKNGKLCNKCNQVKNCDEFQLKMCGLI